MEHIIHIPDAKQEQDKQADDGEPKVQEKMRDNSEAPVKGPRSGCVDG